MSVGLKGNVWVLSMYIYKDELLLVRQRNPRNSEVDPRSIGTPVEVGVTVIDTDLMPRWSILSVSYIGINLKSTGQ